MENNRLYITFTSHNGEVWDKLKPENFKPKNIFTTFRGYGPKKDKYYNESKGKKFIVKSNGESIGEAVLLKKRYIWSTELTIIDIRNDTKQSFTMNDWKNLMEKFYGNSKVFGYLLTFQITDVY